MPKPAAPGWLTPRLGVMFFFETAGVAAYAPLLSHHMQRGVGLSPYEMSLVYATGPVAALLAPLATGGAGLGALAGQLGTGALLTRYAGPGGPRWPAIFAVPLALGAVAVCLLAFGYKPGRAGASEG